MWSQFQVSSGFGTDLEAGKTLVDYMNAGTTRGGPRTSASTRWVGTAATTST